MRTKMKTKLIFLSILLHCFIVQTSFSQRTFTLKNSTNFNRLNELVEVSISSAEMATISTLALYDGGNNPIPYQASYDNKIVFQASINAGATQVYTLKPGTPANSAVKTYTAIKMPTNRADIAWENDRAAYRMYSKVLLSSEPNTSNGVDLWVKKMSSPIIDKMYTYSNYHSEQVEGVDAYSVGGKTLGMGGVAAYTSTTNKLWLHAPYDNIEIIENGPLRSEFILTYKKVEVDGDYYTKTLRITTNANGLLNKAVVKYEGKIKPMKLAAGIYLHTNMSHETPNGTQYTSESNIIGYAENKSEGTVTSANARFYAGVYMPNTTTATTTVEHQRIIYADYAVGSEFTYYFGGGWNIFPAGEFSKDTDWFDALKNFKEAMQNPLLPVDVTKLPSKKEILNAGAAINGRWIGEHQTPGNNLWRWATYSMGNIEFYKVYPYFRYLDYALLWADNNNWAISEGTSTINADNHTCGQTYIDLYTLGKADISKLNAIKATMDYQISNRTHSADWWWVDAAFMAMPTLTRLGNVYNDTKYYDKMYAMFANVRDTLLVNNSNSSMWPTAYRNQYGTGPILSGYPGNGLYDKTNHFWWRDWGFQPNMPPKRDPNAIPTWGADVPKQSPGGKNIYWSRGNGWALAALARTLITLPETDAHRNEYLQVYLEMVAALKACQREDGFWNMNLGDAAHFPGAESTGTALFAYGIAIGINHNILDKSTYYPVMAKAWNGLAALALDQSGNVKLLQNEGEGPINPANLSTNVDFGIGILLLAVSEISKLAEGDGLTPPAAAPIAATGIAMQTTKSIIITFDDAVNENTALDKKNYTIQGKATISSIAKHGANSVLLHLTDTLNYGKYSVVLNDIQNATGGVIEPNTTLKFSYTVPLGLTPRQTEIGVTAIGSQTGNPPANVMDANLNTRWSQQGQAGQWIQFDMGEEVDIFAVDIAWYRGNERISYYDIAVSSNGVNFTPVLSGLTSSGQTLELERDAFDPVSARYLRIICNSNSAGGEHWNSITETRIIKKKRN